MQFTSLLSLVLTLPDVRLVSNNTYSKVRYCLCCHVCQLVPFPAFPALIQSQPLSQINCPLQYQVSQHETEESGIQVFTEHHGIQVFTEHLDHSASGHKWLVISDSSRFCHHGQNGSCWIFTCGQKVEGHISFYFALWAKKPDSAPEEEGGGAVSYTHLTLPTRRWV